MRIWKSLKRCCLLGGCSGGLALVGFGCQAHHTQVVQHPWIKGPQPPTLHEEARAAVQRPLGTQAHNGFVLEHTLWNHYFVEGKGELHSSGEYLLDRLARRDYAGQPLHLYVQTARDLAYAPQIKGQFTELRMKLDAERLRAVTDYLQASYPGVVLTLDVIDPNPVGMSALEAARAARQVRETGRGVLPPESLLGLGSLLRTLGSGGEGGMGGPGGDLGPAATGTGPGGAGAFGGDAPTGDALDGGAPAGGGGIPGGAEPALPAGPEMVPGQME